MALTSRSLSHSWGFIVKLKSQQIQGVKVKSSGLELTIVSCIKTFLTLLVMPGRKHLLLFVALLLCTCQTSRHVSKQPFWTESTYKSSLYVCLESTYNYHIHTSTQVTSSYLYISTQFQSQYPSFPNSPIEKHDQ